MTNAFIEQDGPDASYTGPVKNENRAAQFLVGAVIILGAIALILAFTLKVPTQ